MTQIRLSYEEQILNALNRLVHKRSMGHMEWTQLQFQTIREILQPIYKQVKSLEDEQKYHQARCIAIQYAGLLKERLWEFRSTDTEPRESNTSVRHLIFMCEQVIARTGYVPKEWSITKLHRWIGYIQGVMTVRGFTTVERERNDYKELKAKILAEMALPEQYI